MRNKEHFDPALVNESLLQKNVKRGDTPSENLLDKKTSGLKNENTAELKETDIEKRKKEILNKIIDIENHKGTIHTTQIANIENILTNGLGGEKRETGSAKRRTKWGWGGARRSIYDGTSVASLSLAGQETSFRNWTEVPWQGAGQLILLIDSKKIDERYMESWQKSFIEFVKQGKISRGVNESEIEIAHYKNREKFTKEEYENARHGPLVPKEAIIGLILSPKKFVLHRREHKSLAIPPEQAQKLTINRLSRLLKQKPGANLVPLYDHLGNVIWPKNIPYEEVIEILGQK